jgi:UDP-N-acetylglucosamine--N-acetylmuramyl-(pentapeptide) pyrophosphoryl-undecaprenol N-acetylglucosamine transferase
VLTGNPVRGGFAALPERRHTEPLQLLAFGGSQGSRLLNQALVAGLAGLPGPERLRIIHQTGPAARDDVAAAYLAAGREAEVVGFLDDMEQRLGAADLVLARSGATTCAELQAAGRAAILVPFAKAADDHQRKNAEAMQAAGAADMLEEHELTGPRLAQAITDLVDNPERLAAMGQAARHMARPDAAARVADLLEGKHDATEAQSHGGTDQDRSSDAAQAQSHGGTTQRFLVWPPFAASSGPSPRCEDPFRSLCLCASVAALSVGGGRV